MIYDIPDVHMAPEAEPDAEQLLKSALEGLEDSEEPQVVEVLANLAAAAGKHAVAEAFKSNQASITLLLSLISYLYTYIHRFNTVKSSMILI